MEGQEAGEDLGAGHWDLKLRGLRRVSGGKAGLPAACMWMLFFCLFPFPYQHSASTSWMTAMRGSKVTLILQPRPGSSSPVVGSIWNGAGTSQVKKVGRSLRVRGKSGPGALLAGACFPCSLQFSPGGCYLYFRAFSPHIVQTEPSLHCVPKGTHGQLQR